LFKNLSILGYKGNVISAIILLKNQTIFAYKVYDR